MAKKRYGNELHPLYPRWLSTVQRCTNPKNRNYKHYGFKGISISPDLRSFQDYCAYVSSLPNYDPINLTLDRIHNHLGYKKGNLRWVNNSVQVANQTSSGKGFNKYTGVNWSATHKKWIARVTFEGKNLLSKTFLTEEEALVFRNTFILENSLPHTIQKLN